VNRTLPEPPLVTYVLRLGDNALVLGQQLAALTGHAPILEEDLALANVALDLIGQARLWLSLAGALEGAGRDEDALAYFRDAGAFRNVLLVERPSGDFAQTIARSFLFDTWHFFFLQALCGSRDERIAAIAAKAVREVEYHARRSGDWVVRLGDGTQESRRRMQVALAALWPYTGELFAADDVDTELAQAGVGADPAALHEPWARHVGTILSDATLALPADGWMQRGGKSGHHGEALSYLLAEMQSVRRSVPGVAW
jgi:ring-1,2-phenylacetyl-CoA epoxidase subunit PaaC